MTSIDEHKKAVLQFEGFIKEKLKADALQENQKIVGFCCSEGAVNLFALLLRKKALVSEGFNVNHRFFSSMKRAESRFQFDFQKKPSILKSLVSIEMMRDRLCYGKSKKEDEVQKAVELYFTLKENIESVLGEEL